MASARLRKSFRYPDSDSDSGMMTTQELDEQEQESLIRDLRKQNQNQNTQYKRILTALPILCSIVFLPFCFSSVSSALYRFLSLLSVACLLATGYSSGTFTLARMGEDCGPAIEMRPRKETSKFYLEIFSIAACTTLVVASCLLRYSSEPGNLPTLLLVPGVVFATIRLAEKAMVSVNVDELEKLRYEYKGA